MADLEVAHELADRGAVAAMHWFETGVVAELKADDSPVTVADRAVETLLREGLAELRPGDAILGEELGVSGSGNRTWIIDPIDGTNFFAAGSPYWRIQLALEEDGELVVAMVDSPALGLRWWATRGGGAFERGADGVERRLAVSSTSALTESVVTYYPHEVAARLPAEVQLQAWDRFTLPELVRGELGVLRRLLPGVGPRTLGAPGGGGRRTVHRPRGWPVTGRARRAVLERRRARRAARRDHAEAMGSMTSRPRRS